MSDPARRHPGLAGQARRRAPAEKRERILAAARALFRERGYGATATAEVARRAGVSEGIVFHHFGSKKGLLTALAAAYGRGLALAMFEGELTSFPADGARGMLERAFAYTRQEGAVLPLAGGPADPGETDAALAASRREVVDALAEAFARWSAEGRLRPMQARITAELLFGLVNAALSECFVRGDGSREAAYLDEVVQCIVGATLPQGAAPASPMLPEAPPDPQSGPRSGDPRPVRSQP